MRILVMNNTETETRNKAVTTQTAIVMVVDFR